MTGPTQNIKAQCKKIATFVIFLVAMLSYMGITFCRGLSRTYSQTDCSCDQKITTTIIKHVFKLGKIEKE